MDRRDFLKALPALTVVPIAASARSAFAGTKMKITDLRLVSLRVERQSARWSISTATRGTISSAAATSSRSTPTRAWSASARA